MNCPALLVMQRSAIGPGLRPSGELNHAIQYVIKMTMLMMLLYGACSGWVAGSGCHITWQKRLFGLLTGIQTIACLGVAAWFVYICCPQSEESPVVSLICFLAGLLAAFLASRRAESDASLYVAGIALIPVLLSLNWAAHLVSFDYFVRIPATFRINGKPEAGTLYRRRNEFIVVAGNTWRSYWIRKGSGDCEIERLDPGRAAYIGSFAIPSKTDFFLGICTDSAKIDGVPSKLSLSQHAISFWATAYQFYTIGLK